MNPNDQDHMQAAGAGNNGPQSSDAFDFQVPATDENFNQQAAPQPPQPKSTLQPPQVPNVPSQPPHTPTPQYQQEQTLQNQIEPGYNHAAPDHQLNAPTVPPISSTQDINPPITPPIYNPGIAFRPPPVSPLEPEEALAPTQEFPLPQADFQPAAHGQFVPPTVFEEQSRHSPGAQQAIDLARNKIANIHQEVAVHPEDANYELPNPDTHDAPQSPQPSAYHPTDTSAQPLTAPRQEYQMEQRLQNQIEPQFQHISPQFQLPAHAEASAPAPAATPAVAPDLSSQAPPATSQHIPMAPNLPSEDKPAGFGNSPSLHTLTLPSRIKPLLKTMAAALVGVLLYFSPVIATHVQYYTTPAEDINAPVITEPDLVHKVPEKDRKIVIPKINIDVPIVYGITSYKNEDVQVGLKEGVVHYGETAEPGEIGNNVILGHSSGNFWYSGRYDSAFALADRLEKGDTFAIHHKGIRYLYEIYEKKVVKPDNFSVVFDVPEAEKEPITTLITCTPPGAGWNRLIIHARQISPDPDSAAEAEDFEIPDNIEQVPSDTPRLWERILDWFN